MTLELFEEIRISAQEIVSLGLTAYEKAFDKLKTDISRRKFLDSGLELFRRIIDRVEAKEEISILPFKETLLGIVFDLDFDVNAVQNLLPFIRNELVDFIRSKPKYDANLTRILDTYFELFLENVGNFTFYSSSGAVDILQAQPEYQYSEALYSIVPREIDTDNNRVYTLFPKERYWETFLTQTDDSSYSPLSYNRFAASLGLSKYSVPLSYDSLIIYNGELYKLRPDVASPTRKYFDGSEWIKYTSKRFDQSKSFKKVFQENVKTAFGKFTEAGFDINEIISDSQVIEYSPQTNVNEALLAATFGGNGKQVLDSIRDLKEITDSFGAYEGSPVGGVEYVVLFSEYLLASSLGRNTPYIFDVTNGDSVFGKFNVLYKSALSPNRIPGLKFLDAFGSLKSFVHSQELPQGTSTTSERIIYNPVYSQFSGGLQDRFTSLDDSASYKEQAKVDLLLYSLESVYRRSLSVGDTVKTALNTLDDKGRIPGHEGLGSIKVQMDEFQRVFPPSSYFLDVFPESKITAGLSGSIRYLLNNYSRFSAAVIQPILPGRSLEFFGPWIERISNKLEELLDILKRVGISTSEYIPNISFLSYEASDEKLISFLRSLGFRDSEINKLLEVESFSQLVTNFAPLTDSADLKSFFKAYELAQLIYEFGGQEGIDAYLSFLYSSNPIDSLLNILSLSQKDKSKFTYVNMDRYPKLLGLLIGLTYAVDPVQLIKFEKILGKNNLTLLESIAYIYQSGESTIIKNKEDIKLLEPLVEQMITGVYSGDAFASPALTYSQVNSTSPIALKQWTQIIGDNLGGVESAKIIEGLYDRAKGLTPKELLSVLNGSLSTTELGHILDGFSGGALTSFLRYANLAGLGIKLSNYKNSYQVNNFRVDTSYEFYSLPRIVEDLEELITYISVVKTIFSSELNYNFSTDSDFANALEPLILSQNKKYSVVPDVISAIATGQNGSSLRSIAGDAPIAESPGVGNSRIPNRVPVRNSITPEQAQQIFEYSSNVRKLGIIEELPSSIINKFIKFSEDNLFANEVSLSKETTHIELSMSTKKEFSPATKYELNVSATRPNSKPRDVAKIYSLLEGNPSVRSQALGANYLSSPTPIGEATGFDPVQSCRRFGGSECETLYADSQDRCVGAFNKSLFPESYSQVPGVSSSVVSVDRPLGTFAEYTPSNTMIPTSSFNNPPSFMNLLPQEASVGAGGEPLLSAISQSPIVYEYGGAELSEFGNTEFGIVEFIKAKLERNTEFNCSGFDSPFYYQICINLMKCKRFSPPYNNEYYLNFCPKTLSGGRLK